MFLSGQICEWEGVPQYFGPIGPGFDMADGQAAARMCALNLLFSIRAVAGSLSRVSQVIRLGGFVAAPISVLVLKLSGRWMMNTWSRESTVTPIADPMSQWFGSGLGQSGSTSNVGA